MNLHTLSKMFSSSWFKNIWTHSVTEKEEEKGGGNGFPPISTAEIEKKIEETKRELEKWEEIRQIKQVQEKIDVLMPSGGKGLEEKREQLKYIPKTTFRHIVFSGGVAGGLCLYGALKITHEKGLWDYSDIETVWGTSAGSMLAICLALKYEWSVLDEYLIKRPWITVFKMNLMRLWHEKGLMGKEVVDEIMIPLLAGKGLSSSITMRELFDVTGVEVHIFVTEMIYTDNAFTTIDVSHKTHPDWKVIDAVYASSCLPLVFVPYETTEWSCPDDIGAMDSLVEKRRIFLDGGILAAFPFHYCIKSEGVDESEVLGFYLSKWKESNKKHDEIVDLFTFMKCFASSVFNYTDKTGRKPPISDKACLIMMKMNMIDRFDISLARSEEKRREYISNGGRMCLDDLIEKKWLVPVVEPETVQPDAIQPETVQPDAIQPDMVQPETVQPDMVQPDTTATEKIEI